VLSLFVVVQFKYHVKRLELFKIRRYIKSWPLLLLWACTKCIIRAYGSCTLFGETVSVVVILASVALKQS